MVKAIAEYLGYNYFYNGEMANENYYIVKKGDSLWSIASKYNITVNDLKKLNNLSSNMLTVGQKLLVKDTSSSSDVGVYYTVMAGDTLYGIAKKFNLTVDELKKMNNLSSNNLSINQKLLVSGTALDNSNVDYDTYVVKSGDSLWSIASKFNTTVDKLKSVNNLSSNLLSIGQKLLIPKSESTNNKQYVVKSGDTLYKIAQSNGTTVTDIINLNNLPTTNLSIGQILLLP